MEYTIAEKGIRENRAKTIAGKYGKTLWHYTDIKAMKGILNKGEIWFSRTSDVNDSAELTGFIEDLKNEVKKNVQKEKNSQVDDVFNSIRYRLKDEYPYIFCLSKARDDAAQWERYAEEGRGVAIEFNTEMLYKLVFFNNIIFSEEYYIYDAKNHRLKELLVNYINEGKMDVFESVDGLISNLLVCAMMHKHPSFCSEKEVRLSPLFVNAMDKHLRNKPSDDSKQIYVLNLTDLCDKENIGISEIIESIVIGPKSQETIEKFQTHFDGNDLLKHKVRKSECPLR